MVMMHTVEASLSLVQGDSTKGTMEGAFLGVGGQGPNGLRAPGFCLFCFQVSLQPRLATVGNKVKVHF